MEQVKICNFLSRLPQEVLGFASTAILIHVSSKVNIFSLFDELHTKHYSILYYRVKIGEAKRF
jgi:hypothetical protein